MATFHTSLTIGLIRLLISFFKWAFLFISSFSQHNDKYNTKFDYKKLRWDSNPGPQD